MNFKAQIPWGRACQETPSFPNKSCPWIKGVCGFSHVPTYQSVWESPDPVRPYPEGKGPWFRQADPCLEALSLLSLRMRTEKSNSETAVIQGAQTGGVSSQQGRWGVEDWQRHRRPSSGTSLLSQHRTGGNEGLAKSAQISCTFSSSMVLQTHSSMLYPIHPLPSKFLKYLEKVSMQNRHPDQRQTSSENLEAVSVDNAFRCLGWKERGQSLGKDERFAEWDFLFQRQEIWVFE